MFLDLKNNCMLFKIRKLLVTRLEYNLITCSESGCWADVLSFLVVSINCDIAIFYEVYCDIAIFYSCKFSDFL